MSSFAELRDQGLIRQGRDFSCGAAALATLLTYQWRDPVTEEEVLDALAQISSDEELVERQSGGFSLLDLRRVAQSRGYRAQGFQLLPGQLARLKGSVIVFVEPNGYRHFAVLRGIVGERVLLADPSRGNITLPRYRFLDWWQGEGGRGIVFAVEPLNATPSMLEGGELRPRSRDGRRPALIDARSSLPESALATPVRKLLW